MCIISIITAGWITLLMLATWLHFTGWVVWYRDTTFVYSTLPTPTTYKYLGFLIEQNFSFKLHTENVVSKLKIKLGFFYRNKSCFSFRTMKHLISATFLPVLDYGDLLYMNASDQCLKSWILCTIVHYVLLLEGYIYCEFGINMHFMKMISWLLLVKKQ